MHPRPSLSSPNRWWLAGASGLLLCWELLLGMYSVLLLLLFFFLLVMLPSEIAKLPTNPLVRGFPGVWKLLLLHDSLPRMDLCPYLFCLSLYLLYSVLPPFKENGLHFGEPGVLCQHSEVVLWKLLGIQMIF